VFGTNAIAAFVLSTFVARLLLLMAVPSGAGAPLSLHRWLYTHLFLPWAAPANASLLFAIAYVLLWLALLSPLYRRRLFIRI